MSSETPAKYKVAIVEAVLLEVAAELHPQLLTAKELSQQIVSDPDDAKEVGTAAQAIQNLKEHCLISTREDGIVELTPAAIRAVTLLA